MDCKNEHFRGQNWRWWPYGRWRSSALFRRTRGGAGHCAVGMAPCCVQLKPKYHQFYDVSRAEMKNDRCWMFDSWQVDKARPSANLRTYPNICNNVEYRPMARILEMSATLSLTVNFLMVRGRQLGISILLLTFCATINSVKERNLPKLPMSLLNDRKAGVLRGSILCSFCFLSDRQSTKISYILQALPQEVR